MRKLATAAAVSLALASGGAFGLGLGDIEMRSALNQPMNAQIPLTSVQAGELDGMIVQLASPETFARAGIERSPILNDLQFSVDQSSGTPVIRISSQRPVIEPFLNFLLEVDWPQGRMVREYTVLLDPPVFMTPTATERLPAPEQAAVVQAAGESLLVPTPIERSAEAGNALEAGASAADGRAIDGATEAGEIVSLDVVSDDVLLGSSPSISIDDSEVITLTDLSAPNTAAQEARQQYLAEQLAKLDNITVELADSVEVSDSEVVVTDEVQGSTIVSLDGPDEDSTIVSLDELSEGELVVSAAAPLTAPTGREVRVEQGDTLYEIAREAAGSSVTVQQMMMALLAANESAFINRNINLVRAGAILRIPEEASVVRLTQEQAIAAIGQQNQLWQDYRNSVSSGSTRIATSTGSSDVASTTTTAEAGADADSNATQPAALPELDVPEATNPDLASEDTVDGLSPEARAILENARNEILNRDELRIVADSSPSSTTASATADETTDSDASRLGEVNLKLQLAREELSATRLQAEELADQANELQGTTENLDALVSLRQNEIARLEAQLADARAAEASAEANAPTTAENQLAEVDAMADAAGDSATELADTLSAVGEDLADNGEDFLQSGSDALAVAADDAEDSAAELSAGDESDALVSGSDAVTEADELAAQTADTVADETAAVAATVAEGADEGVNALTAAGEELAQVELIDDSEAAPETQAETAAAPTPTLSTAWYEDFINDPKRLAIAGFGAVGLLGVLGTLLFRRRRQQDEWLDIDEAEFHADDMAAMEADSAGLDEGKSSTTSKAAAKEDKSSAALAGMPASLAAGVTTAGAVEADETLSEVDVYLAYGLHSQAEELLARATESDPNNSAYVQKLLETYHAQGNTEGFHATAQDFHARFGGDENPEWSAIAALGAELLPENELYRSAAAPVEPVSDDHVDDSASSVPDLLSANDGGSDNVNLEATTDPVAAEIGSRDEFSPLDQSLDPAAAFDEDDLEATGDFSEIVKALAEKNESEPPASDAPAADDHSIDFPGFDAPEEPIADAVDEITGTVEDTARGALEFESQGQISGAGDGEDEPSPESYTVEETLPQDELDRAASVDDLTLDIDQLASDLELEDADLMSSELSDLDLPDLTADNELLLDDDPDNGDEMETMLDLARAYIDMGDKDSASSALDEIVKCGNPNQKSEAETLLRKIS